MSEIFTEVTKTERGFSYNKFSDLYGVQCSIQKSSLATDDAIWFGADSMGLTQFIPYGNPSWRDISEDDLLTAFPSAKYFSDNCRMHLSRDQVKALLPTLQHFAETGELPDRT